MYRKKNEEQRSAKKEKKEWNVLKEQRMLHIYDISKHICLRNCYRMIQ